MKYKALVKEIEQLPWDTYEPKSIIYLSWSTAVEFAESLRCAVQEYPEDKNLYEMALGELKTSNLSYEGYSRVGDHHEFLSYFIDKNTTMKEINDKVFFARRDYQRAVKALGGNKERAITIFSREQELPSIFERILSAHNWGKLGLGFFRYYLERHIELDGEDGGHADLVKDFEMNETILEKFYQIRLAMYNSLEK